MLYFRSLLLFILTTIVLGDGETHCRDPADCPLYPLHSCFATTVGLVCKNTREYTGFEVSMNLIETFNYRPSIPSDNDEGTPCHSIPHSTDLNSYVEYRGDQVLEINDLDLIGNCSQQSYCDTTTRTCRRKHGMGSACEYNMECAIGKEYLPGHCNINNNHNNSQPAKVCGLRQDIPSFYYGAALRGDWEIGTHWKEAVTAVMITGIMAACFLLGRHQAGKLVSGVSGLIEKWQGRDDTTTLSGEEVWDQQHPRRTWWYFLPGAKRITRDMQSTGTYVPLDTRPAHPPPYQGE